MAIRSGSSAHETSSRMSSGRDGPIRRSFTWGLGLVLVVWSCSCNEVEPKADSASRDGGRDADTAIPDSGSCDVFWNGAGGFEEDVSCGPDEFRFVDEKCHAPDPDGGQDCRQMGDGRCYRTCETDADCPDPERPHCAVLGLYANGDNYCNDSIEICSPTCRDDC